MRKKDIDASGSTVSKSKEFRIDKSTLLRELTADDADRLYAVIDENRTHLREWLPWVDRQQGVNDTLEFIEGTRKENQDGVALTLGIEYMGNVVGVIGFHEFDTENRQSSMGYWISACNQGKGIITKSCRKLIDYAFSDLKLNRVVMRIARDNVRSRKVAERNGLSQEGMFRQSEWLYDRYVDHVIYAIVVGDRVSQTCADQC